MESELERRVRERTRELQDANDALRRSQQMHATELDAAQRLQHVATQLINALGTEVLYEQILDTAMAILHSDFASIQMFYPERGTSGELRLLGHRGFNAEGAKRWEWVRPSTCTSCGEALRTGRRVVVSDIRNCDFISGSDELEAYIHAGIHGMQTTPLVSRSGALLGMVSTHWREPHELSATELHSLDVLARMAADLIERSRAEEKLRESEQRFRNMADTAPVMIWMAGPDKLWTFVNKTCLDFTGHTLEHKLGYGWIADIHPEDREPFLAKYCSAFDARQEFQSEIRARRADGEYLWMLTAGTPRFVPGEGFAGYIGSCVDLTEVKRTQQEAVARQKLESVGTLASGIAHDFNNLLGGVLAQAELALSECAAGSFPEAELKTIRNVAIGGSEIVRQLMIYAGRESEVVGPVDVSRIVTEMIELLNVSLSKRAVLEMDLGQNLPAVLATSAQLRQIVMNLVTNASDAIGDRDGVIRVTTRCVRVGRKSSGDELADRDHVQLEVSDTGSGMPPETQAKAFDPFFTTKSAGRGLGLAVVDGIVRSLGGTVLLTSESDKGTTVQILLPCAATAAGATGDTMYGVGAMVSPSQDATLLIVEDEDSLRNAIAKMLRKTGFEVFETADGSSAIDLLRANGGKIDVMLLDMTIPGASSPEVVAEAVKARPDIRVILTSAYGQEMITDAMTVPQVRSFIRKPFQVEALVKTLQNVLSW